MIVYSLNTTFFFHIKQAVEKLMGKDLVEYAFTKVGISLSEDRIPIESVYKGLSLLKQYYGPRPLGMHIANNASPSSFHLIGHLTICSKTLKEALESVVRYHSVVMDCERIKFITEADQAYFEWKPINSPEVGRLVLIEFVLSSIWRFGEWSIGKGHSLSLLQIELESRAETENIEKFFQCEVHYSQKSNRMYFPLSWCKSAMPNFNGDVQMLIKHKLDKAINAHLKEWSILDRLRELLQQEAYLQTGLMNHVAETLQISERSLQRNLKSRSTSFSKELRLARLKKAQNMLLTTKRTVSEIAQTVGYSEHSAFAHAYKQWKGWPPIEERNRHLKLD